ncbi:hypothetical protein VPH35_071292 [Triticum aestivum]
MTWLALFSASTYVMVGNGQRTSFWCDQWLDGQVLRYSAPDIFKLSKCKNISVAHTLTDHGWVFGLQRMSVISELRQLTQVWLRLKQVSLQPDTEDTVSWVWNPSQVYTAASSYHCQFLCSFSHLAFDKLWKALVPAKCHFFMWLWLRGRIQTNDNLEIHGIPCNDACNLCDQEDEYPLHLILKCSYARTVWQQVANWSDTPALATHAQETESITEWSNEHTCNLPKKLSPSRSGQMSTPATCPRNMYPLQSTLHGIYGKSVTGESWSASS